MKNAVSSTKIIQLLADLGAASTERFLIGLQNQFAILAGPAEIASIITKLEREGFIVRANEQWRLRIDNKECSE